MRALRWHGNKDIRLDTISEPPLRPGCVKVKIGWAGICGSDLHEYLVGPKNAPTKPHAKTGECVPTTIGHEFSGTITELADDVSFGTLSVGQRCAIFPFISDDCFWCKQEVWGMCPDWGFLGYSGYGGGFSDCIVVHARDVHPIPENMSLEVAALVEPLAVGWHGVKLSEIGPGDSALVLGAGPIGIAVILCLKANGVENISVSEISPMRSEHAKNAGATHVFNPRDEDVAKKTQEVSPDGWGPAAVFECAGVQASMDVAFHAVRGKGTIVNIGIFEKDISINPNILNRRNLKYVGSNIYSRREFQEVIEAIGDGKWLCLPSATRTDLLAVQAVSRHQRR